MKDAESRKDRSSRILSTAAEKGKFHFSVLVSQRLQIFRASTACVRKSVTVSNYGSRKAPVASETNVLIN